MLSLTFNLFSISPVACQLVSANLDNSKIPVISAVGHETDFTIADFVSDLRAPTPSAAAELAVADISELLLGIDSLAERTTRALVLSVERARERLQRLSSTVSFDKMTASLELRGNSVELLFDRAKRGVSDTLVRAENSLALNLSKLETMNPLAVLQRGYSISEKDGVTVRSVGQLSSGDGLLLRFSDGSARVTVDGTQKEKI